MTNSNPVRRLEITPEKQRERGKKGKGIKKGFVLRKTRKCNPRCPLFGLCRFQRFSKQIEGRCALANSDKVISDKGKSLNLSDRQTHRVVKFMFGNREELMELLREGMSNLDMATDMTDTKDIERYLKNLRETISSEFGEKIEHSGKVEGGITINILKPKENEDN